MSRRVVVENRYYSVGDTSSGKSLNEIRKGPRAATDTKPLEVHECERTREMRKQKLHRFLQYPAVTPAFGHNNGARGHWTNVLREITLRRMKILVNFDLLLQYQIGDVVKNISGRWPCLQS